MTGPWGTLEGPPRGGAHLAPPSIVSDPQWIGGGCAARHPRWWPRGVPPRNRGDAAAVSRSIRGPDAVVTASTSSLGSSLRQPRQNLLRRALDPTHGPASLPTNAGSNRA